MIFLNEEIWLFLIILVPFLGLFFLLRKNRVEFAVFSFLAFLIILSIGRPVIKKGYKTIYKRDTEIMILLDHSLSMAVKDIKPSRFNAARKKIAFLLERLKGENIGISIFSDKGEILFFPNQNTEKMITYIKNANIPLKGSTNFIEGISTANSALSGKERIIIVVSDGGDEDINKLFQLIKKMKVRIVFYGIGTEKGGTVPIYNVISKLNKDWKRITDYTGGISVFYTKNNLDINKISRFVKDISKKTEKEVLKIPEYIDISPFISAFSLLVVFLYFASRRVLLSVALFFSLINYSYSGELLGYIFYAVGKYEKAGKEFLEEKDTYSRLNAAVSFMKAGFYKKALNILDDIKAKNPEIVKRVRYNKALIYVLKHKYTKANSILKEIYQMFPEDKKIRKLYLFTNMIVNMNREAEKKRTVVKVREEKPKKHPKSQAEVGTKNPW